MGGDELVELLLDADDLVRVDLEVAGLAGEAAAVDPDALVDDDAANGLLLDEVEQALRDARLAGAVRSARWWPTGLPWLR